MGTLTTTWTIQPLSPFGLLAVTNPGADIYAVPTPVLQTWIIEERVVVLRGFEPLLGGALPEFCETLGMVLDSEIGEDGRHLPLQWAGAFADPSPRYLFFHCDEAAPEGASGRTLFCDTIRLLQKAPPEVRERWKSIRISYNNEFSARLLIPHPILGDATVRYVEPEVGGGVTSIDVTGIDDDTPDAFIAEIRERLQDPSVCYAHAWQRGDIVIADNHALLHGHRPPGEGVTRRIRRVNIL